MTADDRVLDSSEFIVHNTVYIILHIVLQYILHYSIYDSISRYTTLCTRIIDF